MYDTDHIARVTRYARLKGWSEAQHTQGLQLTPGALRGYTPIPVAHLAAEAVLTTILN